MENNPPIFNQDLSDMGSEEMLSYLQNGSIEERPKIIKKENYTLKILREENKPNMFNISLSSAKFSQDFSQLQPGFESATPGETPRKSTRVPRAQRAAKKRKQEISPKLPFLITPDKAEIPKNFGDQDLVSRSGSKISFRARSGSFDRTGQVYQRQYTFSPKKIQNIDNRSVSQNVFYKSQQESNWTECKLAEKWAYHQEQNQYMQSLIYLEQQNYGQNYQKIEPKTRRTKRSVSQIGTRTSRSNSSLKQVSSRSGRHLKDLKSKYIQSQQIPKGSARKNNFRPSHLRSKSSNNAFFESNKDLSKGYQTQRSPIKNTWGTKTVNGATSQIIKFSRTRNYTKSEQNFISPPKKRKSKKQRNRTVVSNQKFTRISTPMISRRIIEPDPRLPFTRRQAILPIGYSKPLPESEIKEIIYEKSLEFNMFKNFKNVKFNTQNQIILKNSVQYNNSSEKMIILPKTLRDPRRSTRSRKQGFLPKKQTTLLSLFNSYNILIVLLRFTEDGYPIGPSLNVFKLCLLSTRFQSLIKALYSIQSLRFFSQNYGRAQICDVLEFQPDFSCYQKSKLSYKNLVGAWEMWDSIFLPVPGFITRHDGKQEVLYKANSLQEQISFCQVDLSGGYYNIRNVKTGHNTFLDIQMLIEKGVDEEQERNLRNQEKFYRQLDKGIVRTELLKRWESVKEERLLSPGARINKYRKSHRLNQLSQFFLHKEGIKHILNGYGRIIEHGTSHIDTKGNYNPLIDFSKNYIISITEGHFKQGQLSGFGRILDNDGECQIGFWRLEDASNPNSRSRPWGKYAHYYKSGSFKRAEGIYLQDCTKHRTIKNYLINEAPSQLMIDDDKYQMKLQSNLRAQSHVVSKKQRTIYMI